MTGTSFYVSPELDQALEELARITGSKSKDEVILRSIVLMKIAAEAKQKGEKVLITTQDEKPVAEIRI